MKIGVELLRVRAALDGVGVEVGAGFLKVGAELLGVRVVIDGVGVGVGVRSLKIGVELPGVGAAHTRSCPSLRPIRVLVTGQETIGYDPYPVIRERLPDPSSGTVPDTTIISEHQILSREWSGNSWKRSLEPVMGSRFRNASGFHRIRPVPAVRF